MPVPINIDAANAIELSLTTGVTQDVNDSGTTYTVWYKHTAPADGAVLVFAYGDDSVYFVRTRVFLGPTSSPTAYLNFNNNPVAFDKPIQVPVRSGIVYYFSFTSEDGDVSPAVLNLNSAIAPALGSDAGDIYINDENEGYPLVVVSQSTGAPKQFEIDIANGEGGAVLTSGTVALEDTDDNTVSIYDDEFAEIATVAFAHTPASFISLTSNRSDTFYLGNRGSGVTAAFVQALSAAGVLGQTWTLPASGLYGMAVALDDSILYWGSSVSGSAVQRYDLVNDVPLPDLAVGIANYGIAQDMFVLSDGTILVGYARNSGASFTFVVKQYDTAGATLNTYNFSTGTTTTHRMAIGVDDPDSFWLKIHQSGGAVEFQNILIADGSTITTLNSYEFTNGKAMHTYALTSDTYVGNAASCPFWLAVSEVAPPPPPEPSGVLGFATELPIRWVRRTPVLS